jgi:hypothetical protein
MYVTYIKISKMLKDKRKVCLFTFAMLSMARKLVRKYSSSLICSSGFGNEDLVTCGQLQSEHIK